MRRLKTATHLGASRLTTSPSAALMPLGLWLVLVLVVAQPNHFTVRIKGAASK